MIEEPPVKDTPAPGHPDAVTKIRTQAEALVVAAVEAEVIVAIELEPLKPLAMGHYRMVIQAFPKHPY